ncbi:hypothetical protein RB195_017334 [Necator americanus]|uniref:Uncharacterized protein n=1 Tax=Necator americanus TaxID=51031 RepID=A0ABR1C4S2_NECAM
MDKLSSAGYRSSTSSTSLTKLENILDDNCEGTKQVEEMLGPVRPVKTDHPSMALGQVNVFVVPDRSGTYLAIPEE